MWSTQAAVQDIETEAVFVLGWNNQTPKKHFHISEISHQILFPQTQKRASFTDCRLCRHYFVAVPEHISIVSASNIHEDGNKSAGGYPEYLSACSKPYFGFMSLQCGEDCWGKRYSEKTRGFVCVCVRTRMPENRHVQCTKVTCSSSTQCAVSAGSQCFYL